MGDLIDFWDQKVLMEDALRGLNLGLRGGKGQRRGRGRGRGRGGAQGPRPSKDQRQRKKEFYNEDVSEELLEPLKVFVGCLRHEVTEMELRDVLQQYARVRKVIIIRDKFTKISKCYGFVVVYSKEDVDKLLNLKDGDLYIRGKAMVIRRARKQIFQPGHAQYKRVDLSDRPYDLSPLDPDLPSAHILVDDVLVKIISYLPIDQRIRIERVCRRWQALVHLSFAPMTSLDIHQGMMGLSRPLEWPVVSKLLVLTGPSLKVLKISDTDHLVRTNLLRSIGQLCPNLVEIEMNLVRGVTHSSLEEFSHYCPGLKTFISRGSPDFTEKSLHALLTNFKSLECVDISMCINPVGTAFTHLPGTIKELHLGGTQFKQENLEYIPQKCPNLEVLDVLDYNCPPTFYEKLAQKCPKLKTLHMEFFTETVVPYVTSLKGLRSLSANGGGLAIDKLIGELPLLECLDLEMVTVEPTTDFSHMKDLRKLIIEYWKNAPRRETLMSITKCTKLEEVRFEGMEFQTFIPKNFLTELVKNCPSLKIVDISILEIDVEDLKKLKELVKNRTRKLVIISKKISNEVLECDYDADKLDLACKHVLSDHSDTTDSDYLPHDLDDSLGDIDDFMDYDVFDDDCLDDLFVHWSFWYNGDDVWSDL